MAYAVLVSLTQTIDEILNHDRLFIHRNQKERIKSIHGNVVYLQAFLEDFPERVDTALEGKIRDVSTEAEDVIERFMWKKQFESSYRRPWHWWLRHDLDALRRVAKKFDSIAMNIKTSFKIKDFTRNVDSPAAAASSSSSSRLVAPSHKKEAMVGFDDDLLAIKERLCGESSKLQVIPVVGMGGIGKTTLARSAYDDPLTMEYFDIRAWVTLSQDYSAQKVVSELLFCMKEFNTERSDQSSNDELKVYQSLKGRRYLIIMDDMWSTQAWDDVRRMFPDDNNGSRIMLTTRLSDVAAYADSSSRIHEMHLMDTDQSWNLLKHKVFTHEEDCPLELENTGKEIARSCGGLPLAISVIGGLLSTSKTRSSWQKIADNVKPAITSAKDGQIKKILSLSYTHLPHHLRPCFLYMGAFPEDYNINVSRLIKLWVAEGFLKYSNGSKSYEEVAEEYLEDLVKRSLVLVTMTRSNGKIKSCSVHDLVLDLCVRKAKELRLFTLVDNSSGEIHMESIKYQRRIYITRSELIFPADSDIGNSAEKLRTIICFEKRLTSLHRLRNFKLLRILDMVHNYPVRQLPVEVFKLFRLRYLAFRSDEEIPADISNLQNLQTLIILPNEAKLYHFLPPLVVCLPKEIWKMRQLRHLVGRWYVLVPFLEEDKSTCGLENLVTLRISGDNTGGTALMFKMIPNLKKLKITHSGNRSNTNDYHLDELVHLHQLENLTLTHFGSHWGKFEPAFPKTLKKLTLSGWLLAWDGDVMRSVGSLPNLQVLKLKSLFLDDEKWETREGEFSQLKFLVIERSNLKQWITESSHFPTLKCLLLHRCRYLFEIPDGIVEIQTLELIEVKGDNRYLAESAQRIQEEQQDLGNYALQVRCI